MSGCAQALRDEGFDVIEIDAKDDLAAQLSAAKPDAVTNDDGVIRWRWKVSLRAHGTKEIEFVAGDGHEADAPKVQADVLRWKTHFSGEFDGFKRDWQRRWADAFTPGNHHFSGNLPVLADA